MKVIKWFTRQGKFYEAQAWLSYIAYATRLLPDCVEILKSPIWFAHHLPFTARPKAHTQNP
jgi:hypothetical protein